MAHFRLVVIRSECVKSDIELVLRIFFILLLGFCSKITLKIRKPIFKIKLN